MKNGRYVSYFTDVGMMALEVKWHAQGHTASERQSKDSNTKKMESQKAVKVGNRQQKRNGGFCSATLRKVNPGKRPLDLELQEYL